MNKAVDHDHRATGAPLGGARLRAVREATSRIGPLVRLPEVLREFGVDPTAVLREAGFDPTYFADPDMPMQYRAGSRLLNHCAAVTGCEHLGLLLGERAGPEALGLPGLLVMSAESVGTGLRELVRYMGLHDRGAVVTLNEDGEVAVLGYDIVADVEAGDELQDLALTIACNLMRGFCGEAWHPTEVLLPRRRPADGLAWRRYFRVLPSFEATRCALRFPAHWLAVSPQSANPALHQYLQKEAERLQSLQGKDFVDEVRRIVRGMVSTPPCSAPRVARMLGMHERTLNRRLQADGTNFSQVRDQVLYSTSRQMLAATSMRVGEMADALGYAEASAFIHAFTRWSGQTPDQWRRDHQRAGHQFSSVSL